MSKHSITSLTAVVSLLIAALPQVVGAQPGLAYETERIAGSEIPVTYHLIMTPDGLYTPIGLRKPAGDGPFPIVLFASGNGGEGLPYVRDYSHNRGWTLEQFLEAGYAVAWLRYRAEVDVPEYGSALTSRGGSGRPRFDRAPLEYEDVIATIEYVKTLPFVDADRVGYMGMSHGGEMLMKMASVYDGIAAGIASEPASAAFLARRPRDPAAPAEPAEPETANAYDETKLAAAVETLRGRIDENVAMVRIAPIDLPIFVQGRSRDHNQPVFRLNYELLREAGKDVRWKTYDHDEHGFAYVARGTDGRYAPDAVQREVVADSIAFFDAHLK
jgi:dienelactone hydrolase